MCQFSVKMNNFEFFDLNLGKLPNYVQGFGSNFVEGNTPLKKTHERKDAAPVDFGDYLSLLK